MFRLKTFGLGVASVAMMALMGCASTNITNSWVVPDAQPIAFERTIVVFMSTSETVRRTAEDQLVQRIGAVATTPPFLAVVFLPLFLPVAVLLQQYFDWSGFGTGKRYLYRGLMFMVVWFPLLVYGSLPALEEAMKRLPFEVPMVPLQWLSGVSPLSLLLSVAGGDLGHGGYPLLWGIAGTMLLLYMLASAGLVILHVQKLRGFRAEAGAPSVDPAESS